MPIYSFRAMGWFPDFLLYYAMLSTDTRLDPQRQELWEGLGHGDGGRGRWKMTTSTIVTPWY